MHWRSALHPKASRRTAAKYSNPYTLRLPWASIHVHARLHRLTVSGIVPVVCIQKSQCSVDQTRIERQVCS